MRYLLALLVILGLGVAYVYVSTPYDILTAGSDYHQTSGDYYNTPSKVDAYDAILRSENRVLCNDDVSVTKGKTVHFIAEHHGCYGFAYEPVDKATIGIVDVSDLGIVGQLKKQATPYPVPKGSPCSNDIKESEGGT